MLRLASGRKFNQPAKVFARSAADTGIWMMRACVHKIFAWNAKDICNNQTACFNSYPALRARHRWISEHFLRLERRPVLKKRNINPLHSKIASKTKPLLPAKQSK